MPRIQKISERRTPTTAPAIRPEVKDQEGRESEPMPARASLLSSRTEGARRARRKEARMRKEPAMVLLWRRRGPRTSVRAWEAERR